MISDLTVLFLITHSHLCVFMIIMRENPPYVCIMNTLWCFLLTVVFFRTVLCTCKEMFCIIKMFQCVYYIVLCPAFMSYFGSILPISLFFNSLSRTNLLGRILELKLKETCVSSVFFSFCFVQSQSTPLLPHINAKGNGNHASNQSNYYLLPLVGVSAWLQK